MARYSGARGGAALCPLLLLGCIPPAAPPEASPPPPKQVQGESAMLTLPDDYRLVWQDEFDTGELPDPRRWAYDTHRNRQGWYNGEAQYYARNRPRNVRLEDGKLIVEAHAERLNRADHPDWGGQDFTSGRLVTRGRESWRQGFFEVRARLPCGRGTWPALWLLPERETGRWQGGEVDIAEHVGAQPGVVHHSVQTPDRNFRSGNQRSGTTAVPDACTAFHRYQLHWTDTWIRIGVDDRVGLSVRVADLGIRLGTPMFLIVNLAIGGHWGGAQGVDAAALPARLEVDYVRVYQRDPA